ncbi:MAG: hypothetical protein GTN62_05165 [Gemmatimonadales bacterium]|nr:hypothetical protein [Gemmatimonadales bacterium]NIN10844.1 hypothetical protein [Gemmatimonadales bacterium]NIN49487.1 hypothetical protein [Gemmatimonadales bacterium]NIP06951.1 hypothetical protein [Gemmatimonadales bacterium]NIR01627.1 hypothetical protein [Gemmatimonadales bacterium]
MIDIERHRRTVLAGYLVVLLALMLAPVPSTPDYVPGNSDKAVHVALFLGLGALAYWNLPRGSRRGFWPVVGVVASLAGLMELAQGLLPYRSGDVLDFLWGAAGALVGAGVAALIAVRREAGAS